MGHRRRHPWFLRRRRSGLRSSPAGAIAPIRLIQIAPGVDASAEPLLSHAGPSCELGGPVEVAMNGIRSTSDCIRQFLTTVTNDLDQELLAVLAGGFNDPAGRARRSANMRQRLRLVHQRQELEAEGSDTPEP